MLSVFTLRLAAGMSACLLLLSPSKINPRYFRTHFLTVLALGGVAWIFVPTDVITWAIRGLLLASMVVAFAGSVSFSLENAPGGMILTILENGAAGGVARHARPCKADRRRAPLVLIGDAASGGVSGSDDVQAMLMGHLYLITSTMSLTPLFRLLGVAGVALLLNVVVDGIALACWTHTHSSQ